MNKAIKKGYTLTCTSWENDGDNYRTKSMTVQNKDYAQAIKAMCESVFKSCNNGDGGIGNCNDECGNGTTTNIILDFVNKWPIVKEQMESDNPTDEEIVDFVMELNGELMGYSEWYYSRISESCIVTYSSTDIAVEEVKF